MAWSRTASRSDPEALLGGALRAIDVAVVLLSGYLAYLPRVTRFDSPASLPSAYLTALLAAALLTVVVLHVSGVYRPERLRQPVHQVAQCAVGWAAVLGLLLLLSALTKTTPIYSRVWFGTWALLGLVGLVGIRALVSGQVARWRARGLTLRRLAVVGAAPRARTVARQLLDTGDYDIVGLVTTCLAQTGPDVVGTLADLEPILRRHQVEEVVVVAGPTEAEVTGRVMLAVRGLPIDVRLVPQLPDLDVPIHGFDRIAGVPMLHLWRRPLTPWQLLLKDIEDRVLAAVLLVVLSPLMLIVAVAVRLDSPGPVLYRQRRAGLNNWTFELLKFRSMAHRPGSEDDAVQAWRNDPRVTRVGAVLRRASLDELPQLVNVLRGEMSLVGPRPHPIAQDTHYSQLISVYLSRQRMKPGMTGWAQINGLRGETETPEKMQRRVQADLYYIENWSVWLDLRILFLTPFVALFDRNAY